ncbi:MAG: ABC transporter substrate-binding protein, partial [Anaerolineae bacterium]|nr:ABC transporter substrate-binding protein [Anaerolineae bacterium]
MAESFLVRMKNRLSGPQPIKIGVVTTKSGALDYYGTMQVRGLELGIEYATHGAMTVAGHPIELLVEDDAGDPTTGGRKA